MTSRTKPKDAQNNNALSNGYSNGHILPHHRYSEPLPSRLTELMFGFCASQTLFVACELGIFDALHATTPLSGEDIAEKLSTNQHATCRLLDALTGMEFLKKHQFPTEPSKYSNTPMADKYLTSSSPESIKCSMAFGGSVLYHLFGNLQYAVQEGQNQWKKTFDRSSADDFFKDVVATKAGCIRLMEGMRGTCRPAAAAVVKAFDLSAFNQICDLGGCTGDLAYAACTAYPNMKITVLDLPPVVQNAPHFRPSMEECPNQHNVTFVAGDFFEPTLPAADLYVLTHVLHDWGESKIDALLSNVYRNLPPGGGLLVGELLLEEDKTGPLVGVLASLTMLVLCDKGARERSGLEYKQLLEKHGFVDVQYRYTGNSFMDAVFCKKP